MKPWMKTTLALLIIFGSLIALVYPFVSNYLYDQRTDEIIAEYEEQVDTAGEAQKAQLWEQAVQYNEVLRSSNVQLTDPFAEEALEGKTENYDEVLNLTGSGIMSYVEIPKIGVFLPIYHGTSNDVLETAIGHLEGSSVPVGGLGTHVVVSGHTGLKKARLFTDLTELIEGDHFLLHTLGETLAYEVDQVKIVEPHVTEDLLIRDGFDYVTLVTCTPYGVNSHRLLVRGHRIEVEEEQIQQIQQETREGISVWMQEYTKALIAGGVIVLVLIIVAIIWRVVKKRRQKA